MNLATGPAPVRPSGRNIMDPAMQALAPVTAIL